MFLSNGFVNNCYNYIGLPSSPFLTQMYQCCMLLQWCIISSVKEEENMFCGHTLFIMASNSWIVFYILIAFNMEDPCQNLVSKREFCHRIIEMGAFFGANSYSLNILYTNLMTLYVAYFLQWWYNDRLLWM